jgi:cysteinyl-tRNA synthetase
MPRTPESVRERQATRRNLLGAMVSDPPTPLPPRAPFPLRFFNTPARAVEEFAPITPGRAGVYTCGPTVYAPQHVGNMRSQLFADLLRRVLEAAGLAVTHVVNITDVGHLTSDADEGDDKVEAAAARSGRSAAEVAAVYTEQWLRDRRALNCLEPSVLPRATDHIAEQVALVERLEAQGVTYRTSDGIYFDVSRFPRYADFAHLRLDEQDTSGRVGNLDEKRQAADFALWKFSPPGVRRQQEWPSPWGVGFPGWHVECSAMATRYLGEHFDIHTGGVDHIAVHHTNEVAQSECGYGVHPWVNYWLHNEFLDLGGAKMSKSAGGTVLLDDLVAKGIEPLAFRYFFLQARYRSQQALTDEALAAAAAGLRNLRARALDARAAGGDVDPERAAAYRDRFWRALGDDLDAPEALAVASGVVKARDLTGAEKWALLVDFDDALGLGVAGWHEAHVEDVPAAVLALLDERAAARDARDWARADAIRDELAAAGWTVVDTPAGAKVSR